MKLVPPTHPILMAVVEPVSFPSPSLSRITSEMLEFMIANNGCGLAAPQVGLNMGLFTYKVGSAMGVAINPEIVERSPEQIDFKEGCLTFGDKIFWTKRSKWVSVRFQDLMGKPTGTRRLDGLLAIVFQHEYDHLNGRLVSQHGVEEQG